MALRWKDSVRLDHLHSAIVLALWRAEEIYRDIGVDCWLTSGNDAVHMVGSKHYDGRAVDLRVHNLPDLPTQQDVATRLRRALGPQFTVLLEDPDAPNSHLHIQFDGR